MIRKTLSAAILGLSMVAGAPMVSAQTSAAADAEQAEALKAVYHINDSKGQALAALRNMRNHLDVAPKTKIVAIMHADGIDYMTTDYDDAEQVGPLISGLASRGVRFEVCEITIKRKNLSKDDFVLEANFTPSGVVRLAQLQAKEGYAYIKP